MTSPWSAGWVGWTEKRVEDVLAADALLAEDLPEVRWVLVGGPDSAYRGYEAELHRRAPGWSATRLHRRLHADVVARYSVPAVLPQWRALLDGLTLVDSPSRRRPR